MAPGKLGIHGIALITGLLIVVCKAEIHQLACWDVYIDGGHIVRPAPYGGHIVRQALFRCRYLAGKGGRLALEVERL